MVTIDWSLFCTLVFAILGADSVKFFISWLMKPEDKN